MIKLLLTIGMLSGIWVMGDAQLSQQEMNTISELAIHTIEERYRNLVATNARLLTSYYKENKNWKQRQIDGQRRRFVHPFFTGPARIFADEAVIIRGCNPNFELCNVQSHSLKINNWLELKPNQRKQYLAVRDVCITEIDQNRQLFYVNFLSRFEVEATGCANKDQYESRRAILSYLRKSNGRWQVLIQKIEFDCAPGPCLDLPLPDNEPPPQSSPVVLSFIHPLKGTGRSNAPVYELQAAIQSSEEIRKVRLWINGKETHHFNYENKAIRSQIALRPGRNKVRILVSAGKVTTDKTAEIFFEPETNPSVTPPPLGVQFISPVTERISEIQKAFVYHSPVYVTARVTGVPNKEGIQFDIDEGSGYRPFQDFEYDVQQRLFRCMLPINTARDPSVTRVRLTASAADGERSVQKERIIQYVDPSRTEKDTIHNLHLVIEKKDIKIGKLREDLAESKEQTRKWRNEADSLRRSLSRVGRDHRRKRQALKNQINYWQRRYRESNRFRNDTTLFIGINYGLFEAPFLAGPADATGKDPLEQAFQAPGLSRFGLSLYYHIGLFASNFRRYDEAEPEFRYTVREAGLAQTQLRAAGKSFQAPSFAGAGANLRTANFGIYVYTHLSPLYLMLGVSHVSGSTWDWYGGDLNGTLQKNKNGYYALDYRKLDATDIIAGLAYVRAFFQIEAGYNKLYKDFFMNVGMNVPIAHVNLKALKWKNRK